MKKLLVIFLAVSSTITFGMDARRNLAAQDSQLLSSVPIPAYHNRRALQTAIKNGDANAVKELLEQKKYTSSFLEEQLKKISNLQTKNAAEIRDLLEEKLDSIESRIIKLK